MEKFLIILGIVIIILLISYPLVRLISKAWFKGYFEEITNVKYKNFNKKEKK